MSTDQRNKVAPLAMLAMALLGVASTGGFISQNICAESHVALDGQVVFYPFCLILSSLAVLHLCCLGSYTASARPTDFTRNCIMISLLAGSSLGWRVNPSWQRPVQLSHDADVREAEITCSKGDSRICKVKIDLTSSVAIKTGHGIKFNLRDNHGGLHEGELTIEVSRTNVEYSPDVILPYYELGHVFSAEGDDIYGKVQRGFSKNQDVLKKMRTGNNTVVLPPEITPSQIIPEAWREKTLGTLPEKFKCGLWTAGDKGLRQGYAIYPRGYGGHILWTPADGGYLDMRVCINLGGKKCVEESFYANDEIKFEGEGFTIKLERSGSVTQPVMPNLLTRYSVSETGSSISLHDWKIVHKGIRGDMKFNTLGAVQSSCVTTKLKPCSIGSFSFNEVFSWDVMSITECSPEKEIENKIKVQDGFITATIIVLIVAAGVSGAIVGGVKAGASCKHCTVKQVGVTSPDYHDAFAAQYAPISELYRYSKKALQKNASLIEKDGQLYPPTISVGLEDFERERLILDFKTTDDFNLIIEAQGAPKGVKGLRCTLSLAGGLGTCRAAVEMVSENKNLEVSWRGTLKLVTRTVSVEGGINDVEFGVSGYTEASSDEKVCFGEPMKELCTYLESVDVTTNPDIKTVNPEEEDNIAQGKDGLDFKGFWGILGKWWEKLIVVALIIASVILGIVVLVMAARVFKAIMILCNMKKVTALNVHVGTYLDINHRIVDVEFWTPDSEDANHGEFILGDHNWTIMRPHGIVDKNGTEWFRGKNMLEVNGGEDAAGTLDIRYSTTNRFCNIVPGMVDAYGDMRPAFGFKERDMLLRVNDEIVPLFRDQGTKTLFYKANDTECGPPLGEWTWGKSMNKVCQAYYHFSSMSRKECGSWPRKVETSGRWKLGETYDAENGKGVVSWRNPRIGAPSGLRGYNLKNMVCKKGLVIGYFHVNECEGTECLEHKSEYASAECAEDYIMESWDMVQVKGKEVGEMAESWWLIKDQPGCIRCGMNVTNVTNAEAKQILSTKAGDKWWNHVYVIDQRVEGKLMHRNVLLGDMNILNVEEFHEEPGVNNVELIPIVRYPSRTASGIYAGTIYKTTLGTTTLPDSVIISLCKIQMNYKSGTDRWEVDKLNDMIHCKVKCKHCVFNYPEETVHVYNSKEFSQGCHFYNGDRLHAHPDGPLRGDCACESGTAWCVKPEHIAVVPGVKCEEVHVDGATIGVYRGSYGCGDLTGFEYGNDGLTCDGSGYIYNSTWENREMCKKGDRVNLLGEIHVVGMREEVVYNIWRASSARVCTEGTWNCAWNNYRGITLLLILLPSSFLLFIIVSCLISLGAKMYKRSINMKIGGAITGIADRVIGDPERSARLARLRSLV